MEDLLYLSLVSGRSILSFAPPLNPAEVRHFLNSIDTSLLPPPALQAYNRVRRRLRVEPPPISYSTDNFAFFMNVNSTLQARTRFNTNIAWEPLYPKIPALISVPMRFHFGNFFQLYFENQIQMDPEFFGNARFFGTNIPTETSAFDASFPLRAFLAAGGSWWNFQIGRDRVSWGTGQMGNLLLSDNPDYHEFMQLSFFSRVFKYTSFVAQMPLELRDHLLPENSPPWNKEDHLWRTMNRHLYIHRLDINLFNRLSIGLMEGLMVGNSPLQIRYLNPAMIFHSFYSGWNYDRWADDTWGYWGYMNSSIFSVEVNWNVTNSLALYGQFVMDDFRPRFIVQENSTVHPNGLGRMAGIRYSHTFNTWASIFYFEFIWTDPFLYMNSSPFASFIHMRYLSLIPGRVHYSYLGYPRDTLAFTLGAIFFRGNAIRLSGNLSLVISGEMSDMTWQWERSWEAFQKRTPTGTAQNKFITSFGAHWKPLQHFAINFDITGIYSRNNNNLLGSTETGGQAAISVSFFF